MANVHVCVVVAVITLFSFIQIGAGIRCYICQSNLDRHCDDPFNASFTTRSNWGETPYFLTQDCSSLTTPTTFSSSMKAVCRKQVQIIYDKRTVARSCSWQHVDEPVGKCPQAPVASHIKVEFCETCDHDGCNSAPGSIDINVATQIFSLVPAIFAVKWALF
ncbi:uncharacterized protein LOC123300924 isoform X1 [Chrysoperla carnea]|uniref:uncharacterized protein LOC123300924 isoform X1 n=1 Tax=Chrysoperla carnea TaxID=189513 RepID=UPI001D066ACD|nr:uncharacterized protein LOC123300924 isoform X1 [Chrysoperla carnea]